MSGKQGKINQGVLYAWPMGIWLVVFFIAPLAIILIYSFLTKGLYGSVIAEFSLKAFKEMANPKYAVIVLRTIKISIIATTITILVALPCGYAIARSRHQTLLLLLVIIPFWTNSLIRIFAWISILNNNGIINQLLMKLHITKNYISLLNNQGAVILISVYMYIPYAILPIFTAIDRFDFSLIEAARDLGANKSQSMIKILLPGIKSGIISALIFTFIPIFGSYTVPDLVGDMNSYMLGKLIVDQVQRSRNLPLGSAFSLVITVTSVIGILWMELSRKSETKQRSILRSEEKHNAEQITSDKTDGGIK
ncbi:MAG: ABC transporter permease [Treponemataceae bacterium]|nr:ABC transporter permease [Treponema sp.]MBD5406005.1 ABC transporter permease [Treponema sp.]MDE6244143.1 ABC transporter permease [Treponemataceae bacterium]